MRMTTDSAINKLQDAILNWNLRAPALSGAAQRAIQPQKSQKAHKNHFFVFFVPSAAKRRFWIDEVQGSCFLVQL